LISLAYGVREVTKGTNAVAAGETLLLQVNPDLQAFQQSQVPGEAAGIIPPTPAEQLSGNLTAPAEMGDLMSQAQGSHACASRLNSWVKRNAACLIKSGGKALLVYVPYGRAGWDFPGGTKHEHEFACETAEREACEETGYKVRAVRMLTYNVFECTIVAKDVCRKPVDEGFLKKRWVSKGDIYSVHYRGGTWGNKAAILADHM